LEFSWEWLTAFVLRCYRCDSPGIGSGTFETLKESLNTRIVVSISFFASHFTDGDCPQWQVRNILRKECLEKFTAEVNVIWFLLELIHTSDSHHLSNQATNEVLIATVFIVEFDVFNNIFRVM
jgi:hypothetical protein